MAAKDLYHDAVKNALIKDGWTITDDPLFLKWGRKEMFVDLGAQQLLGAEKERVKIAVEVKSFTGHSEMEDLEKAVGQYIVYFDVLSELDPERILYLAVRNSIWKALFEEPIGKLLLQKRRLRLMIFDEEAEEIKQWKPRKPIAKS